MHGVLNSSSRVYRTSLRSSKPSTLSPPKMAIRFLSSRTSAKNLNQLLKPRFQDAPPVFQVLRNLHAFVSRDFNKSPPGNSRGFVSAPDYRLDEAGVAALGLDNRVPATVITGFLGSGKVRLVRLLIKRICSRIFISCGKIGWWNPCDQTGHLCWEMDSNVWSSNQWSLG